MAGQRPEMLNALLIRPTKILTSKMSIKKERPSKKHFVVTNRGEECRLAEAWNSNRFLTVRRGTRARTPLSAICPCPNPAASRFTAGAFAILSQSGERPEQYAESFRFETMPSSPSLQAWRENDVARPLDVLVESQAGPPSPARGSELV
jgi:hypothetical protein